MDDTTVLGMWLREAGVRQADFAELLGLIRGARVRQSQVSLWAAGLKRPIPVTRLLIAQATDGGVPADSWEP